MASPRVSLRKKLFVSIYLILVGILGISFVLPAKLVVEPSQIDLPADGVSRIPVRVQVQMPFTRRVLFPHPRIFVQIVQGIEFVNLFPSGEVRLGDRGTSYFVKSRAAEGEGVIRFKVHNAAAAQVRVFTHTVNTDSKQDGFPDAFKLTSFTDRENFRRAFALVAGFQSVQESPDWPPAHHDGAGLVCFALREALRRHSETWQKRFGGPGPVPSVEKYNFPTTPLGEKIFRTREGAYLPTDLAGGVFSEYVDVATLKQFNVTFIGRARAQVQRGDLIFFSTPWVRSSPYLVMILLQDASNSASGESSSVVYYRENISAGPAGVKEIRLATLEQDPDPRLRPVESNRFFLGFFRLKVLN
jgi:uncharacterized protein YfaT (DUF1175 family)